MNRPLATAAVAATALLTLTGCFRLDLDVVVGADDLVSGTLVSGVDTAAIEQLTAMLEEMSAAFGDDTGAGEDPELADMKADLEADLEAELGSPEALAEDVVTAMEESGASTSVEAYGEDGYEGTVVSFGELPLADLGPALGAGGDGDVFEISRDGDTYTVDLRMDLTVDPGTSADAEGLGMGQMREPEGRIAITLPGAVTETNGTVEGDRVAWDLTYGEVNELTATATVAAADTDGDAQEATEEESSSTGVVVAAVVGGAALLALVGGLVLARSRRRGPPQA